MLGKIGRHAGGNTHRCCRAGMLRLDGWVPQRALRGCTQLHVANGRLSALSRNCQIECTVTVIANWVAAVAVRQAVLSNP